MLISSRPTSNLDAVQQVQVAVYNLIQAMHQMSKDNWNLPDVKALTITATDRTFHIESLFEDGETVINEQKWSDVPFLPKESP